jgi:glycosyltransferase involved in cell wall biosynthesis
MNNPLVSILTTAYNRQDFIAEAIESVLSSTYQNWELIIVDDVSMDNTVAIAKIYEAKDPRIKVYVNEQNLGDYPNRNMAASYAKGMFLVWVDSDDTMFPDALAKWVLAMQQHDVKFGIFAKMGNEEPVVLPPDKAIQQHFFGKPILSFGPAATITDREYFITHKGFPEKYGPANDMYQHLKMAASTNTLIFNFPLINYRLHDGQELNNPYGYLYNNYNYLKDALHELDLPLSKKQILFLSNKNKRRFIVNAFKYLKSTGELTKTFYAIKLAKISIPDIFKAFFH